MGDNFSNAGHWTWTSNNGRYPTTPPPYGPPSGPAPPFAPVPPDGGRWEWHPSYNGPSRAGGYNSDYDWDGYNGGSGWSRGGDGGFGRGRGRGFRGGHRGGAYGRGGGAGYRTQPGGAIYDDWGPPPRDHRSNYYQGRGGPPRGRSKGRGGYGEGNGRSQQQQHYRDETQRGVSADGRGPMHQGNMPLVPRPGQPSVRLCINTAMGRECEKGTACPYSHADKANRPCKYWHGKGKCDKGLDCLTPRQTLRGHDAVRTKCVGPTPCK
jgi:hypothetical protein